MTEENKATLLKANKAEIYHFIDDGAMIDRVGFPENDPVYGKSAEGLLNIWR